MTQREGGFAADYIPVADRIAAFYAKHPDGSLQSELVELSAERVVMRAYAYRTPTDERPGIGYSSLEIPGRTPYTRGSEIENCETSAWGRAIAALGFEVKKGIATAEEVRNKSHTTSAPAAVASSTAGAGSRPDGRGSSPRPSAPTVPPEPDGFSDLFDHHQPAQNAPGAAIAGTTERMTTRALLGAAEAAGIPQAKIGGTAKRLWGTGKLIDLDDEQRAVVWQEVQR